MKIQKGQKFVVTVEDTGCGNDNSVLLSIGKYISEQHLEELIETGKIIPVEENGGIRQCF